VCTGDQAEDQMKQLEEAAQKLAEESAKDKLKPDRKILYVR